MVAPDRRVTGTSGPGEEPSMPTLIDVLLDPGARRDRNLHHADLMRSRRTWPAAADASSRVLTMPAFRDVSEPLD